ncbi:hypothetical protein [Halarsenatibacter silvermanii]|uniref:Uncharacterized protein n=1 Tax=Halarsenatibacter silvermanii TaxID=321763 RepID=A0A1G9TPD9_9FIRM|nr:hypothetical protein [Halarsenatibacter silvermanii]SDM48975.1 hypothetical protein SAMN04488692_1434 [Halarsenatibacter silvermanii]
MIKKSILFSLVIIFLFTSTSLGFEQVTGSEWHEFSQEEKERYVEGFIDTYNFIYILMGADRFFGDVDIELVIKRAKRDGILFEEEEIEELVAEFDKELGEDETIKDLYIREVLDFEMPN